MGIITVYQAVQYKIRIIYVSDQSLKRDAFRPDTLISPMFIIKRTPSNAVNFFSYPLISEATD